MTDDQILQDELTEAAAAQDNLLPRALSDDLAAGRRRLLRRRIATGGGTAVAVALVGSLSLGAASWLGPNAGGPLPTAGPAGSISTTPAPAPTTEQRTPIGPVKQPTGARLVQSRAFDRLMRQILAEHLDPGKRHLDYSSAGFELFQDPGYHRGGGRIGWRMPGQNGAEGYVTLGVAASEQAVSGRCGNTPEAPRITCRPVRLPNGRTALLGRNGEAVDVTYVQPDGEFVTASVRTLFGNNTEIPVHDMGISDGELLALVQDPRLALPPLTPQNQRAENNMKDYKPSQQEIRAAVVRHLTGGTVSGGRVDNVPEQLLVGYQWQAAGSQAKRTVDVGVDAAKYVSSCKDQTGRVRSPKDVNPAGPRPSLTIFGKNNLPQPKFAVCKPVELPDGTTVMVNEDPASGHIGATYRQPDGDSAFVTVNTVGTVVGAGITRQQVIDLVTDPALDK